MTKINISIPKPCHENWQAMTPENKGRFCDSCQKKVFDFTSSSDREIINAFEKNNNLCGRFLSTQLDRDLVKPKEKITIWLATATALISFIGFGTYQVQAQAKTKVVLTDRKVVGKPVAIQNNKITINGNVLDEENSPLAGVNITVKNKNVVFHTDENGKFNIQIDRNDTLLFSKEDYFSMEDEYTLDSEKGHFTVYLAKLVKKTICEKYAVLGGAVAGIEIQQTKRTFFGRIFHAIGNLFR